MSTVLNTESSRHKAMLVRYRVGGFAAMRTDVAKNMTAMAEEELFVLREGTRYIIAIVQAGKGRMTRVSKVL